MVRIGKRVSSVRSPQCYSYRSDGILRRDEGGGDDTGHGLARVSTTVQETRNHMNAHLDRITWRVSFNMTILLTR